jgi:hypothetical protein
VQRLGRSSGLNHRDGEGKLFVARRRVLGSPLCLKKLSAVQSPVTGTEFSRFPHNSQLPQRKKKEAKKKESYYYYYQVFSSHYRALNTYKGKAHGEARSVALAKKTKTA